ncbi:MAG: pimeloyl-ACP methyl ester carboxylesterase/DNA-binding CsgD family transcriptional regulator [Paracoccaceae bacterium]|jgi:pimeloyl-ACP methyl ester carboxylesterase/DNA-binding CsgD family transcriptional regulator
MTHLDQIGGFRLVPHALDHKHLPPVAHAGQSRRIGGSHIRDDLKFNGPASAGQGIDATAVSRDQVVAAIYETVIRPALYGAFMDAWEDHIQTRLNDPGGNHGVADGQDALPIDPELQAHFSRAYDILEQIGRKAPQDNLLDRIDRSTGFSIVATPDGVILAAGSAARAVLGGRMRLQSLESTLTANAVQLLRGLQQSARDTQHPQDSAVVLATGGQPRHLIARIEPALPDGTQPQQLLVIEALDHHWTDEARQMLVTSFCLSAAEVEIVRNLLAGYSLRQIAQMSDRSEHTVRNQAKAVLAKTGAPGQVDLIRLVAFLINTRSPDQLAAQATTPPSQLPSEMMRMSSGLTMQLFRAGVTTGQPVIFLHGMLDAMAPLQMLQSRLIRHGYQVIAPIRPGFGESQAAPGGQGVQVFVDHVAELIDQLKLRRPVVLAHLAGSVHGHHLLARHSDRVAGMVAVSGGVPITRASQLSNMAPRQRLVAYTARYAPALLPFVLRAGIAQIDGQDIDEFMEALFKPGTHDCGVIEWLGLAQMIQAGYRFSVQQGHVGFTSDSHLVVSDWSADIAGPDTPVIHLHGSQDAVVDVDTVLAFGQAHANVDVRVMSEVGQLLIYERPEAVFAALDELINPSKPAASGQSAGSPQDNAPANAPRGKAS